MFIGAGGPLLRATPIIVFSSERPYLPTLGTQSRPLWLPQGTGKQVPFISHQRYQFLGKLCLWPYYLLFIPGERN